MTTVCLFFFVIGRVLTRLEQCKAFQGNHQERRVYKKLSEQSRVAVHLSSDKSGKKAVRVAII